VDITQLILDDHHEQRWLIRRGQSGVRRVAAT